MRRTNSGSGTPLRPTSRSAWRAHPAIRPPGPKPALMPHMVHGAFMADIRQWAVSIRWSQPLAAHGTGCWGRGCTGRSPPHRIPMVTGAKAAPISGRANMQRPGFLRHRTRRTSLAACARGGSLPSPATLSTGWMSASLLAMLRGAPRQRVRRWMCDRGRICTSSFGFALPKAPMAVATFRCSIMSTLFPALLRHPAQGIIRPRMSCAASPPGTGAMMGPFS